MSLPSFPKLSKNEKIVFLLAVTSFLILAASLIGYTIIRTKQLTTFKPLPTPPYSDWEVVIGGKDNLSFTYPKWMGKERESQNPLTWVLLGESGDRLIDITKTNLNIKNAKKQNPDINFIKILDNNVETFRGDFVSKDGSVNRSLYIITNNNINIWILADYSNFANENIVKTTPQEIVNAVIKSIINSNFNNE